MGRAASTENFRKTQLFCVPFAFGTGYGILSCDKKQGSMCMKVMAIDLGDARTGIAISDAMGWLDGVYDGDPFVE